MNTIENNTCAHVCVCIKQVNSGKFTSVPYDRYILKLKQVPLIFFKNQPLIKKNAETA